MQIEPNPAIALNNAREEARQDLAKPPYPMIELPQRMKPITAPLQSTIVEDALEDRARIQWLINAGATFQIVFVDDGPFTFERHVIDRLRIRDEA